MKAAYSNASSSSKLQSSGKRSFSHTEEIMRKIVPSTMIIDDGARMLIEKCVSEFASSVTSIAAGYSKLDATLQPQQAIAFNTTSPPAAPRQADQRELKSNHIIRGLENMGYSDFQKPLLTYKTILKGKPSQAKAVVNRAPMPMQTTAAAAPAATKKQKGPVGNPVTVVHMPALQNAVAVASNTPGSLIPIRANATLKHTADAPLDFVEQHLRNGPEPLSIAELSRKFGLSSNVVSKRVNMLRDKKVLMKGLKVTHSNRTMKPSLNATYTASKPNYLPEQVVTHTSVPLQRSGVPPLPQGVAPSAFAIVAATLPINGVNSNTSTSSNSINNV